MNFLPTNGVILRSFISTSASQADFWCGYLQEWSSLISYQPMTVIFLVTVLLVNPGTIVGTIALTFGI
jgi:hypothetical protein